VGPRAGLDTEDREKSFASAVIETRSFSLRSDIILTELTQLLMASDMSRNIHVPGRNRNNNIGNKDHRTTMDYYSVA
jgi:hypothetical protein